MALSREDDRKRRNLEAELRTAQAEAPKYLLPTSPISYAASMSKPVTDFELVGVSAIVESQNRGYIDFTNLENMVQLGKLRMIRHGKDLQAEVIADVVPPTISYDDNKPQVVYMVGTALVPKDRKKTV